MLIAQEDDIRSPFSAMKKWILLYPRFDPVRLVLLSFAGPDVAWFGVQSIVI